MLDSARTALAAYGRQDATLVPIDVGLINLTFRVEVDGQRFALQRVNPIFSAEVHQDIEAVTAHLARKGLETPRLVRTRNGELFTTHEAKIWRLMTWIDGENVSRAEGPRRVRAAGELLGRFHSAVQDLEHDFIGARLDVHDTARHVAGLEASLSTSGDHRLFERVEPVAHSILQSLEAIGALPQTPPRVVHGDPKLNNLLFDPTTGDGRCLLDLDTFAKMALVLELGDAFRSWCNPRGEDAPPPRFELSFFEAALDGYRSGSRGLLNPIERDALVAATATIILELAARFARDALDESYFGWDSGRFASRGEHNLLRAEVQLDLARSLLHSRAEAERAVLRTLDDRAP